MMMMSVTKEPSDSEVIVVASDTDPASSPERTPTKRWVGVRLSV